MEVLLEIAETQPTCPPMMQNTPSDETIEKTAELFQSAKSLEEIVAAGLILLVLEADFCRVRRESGEPNQQLEEMVERLRNVVGLM
jgi:hypothetical protein